MLAEVPDMKRIIGILGAIGIGLLALASPVFAAEPSAGTGRVLVSIGGDVTLPAGDRADAVIIVNGAATIAGEVDALIAIDATADLTGARAETVFAVGSTVNLRPGTVVTGDVLVLDTLVHQFGDAEVLGQVTDTQGWLIGIAAVLIPTLIVLWIGAALAMIAAGLLLAGIASRQVRAAEILISREPVRTLVAGLIGLIGIPIAAVLLMATVIGLPLGLGVLIGVWPLIAFLGYLVAGIWLGDLLLGRLQPETRRERPYAAALTGLIVLGLVGILPVVGGLIVGVASLFGFGAIVLIAWRALVAGPPITPPAPQRAPAPMRG
jgi:hypothetical protein